MAPMLISPLSRCASTSAWSILFTSILCFTFWVFCIYARRVQHNTADSQSHALIRAAPLFSGRAVFAGSEKAATATALSTHRLGDIAIVQKLELPKIRKVLLRHNIATSGASHQYWPAPKNGQAPATDSTWDADELYPDLLPPSHAPIKTQLEARKVLAAWARDATAKEKQPGQRLPVSALGHQQQWRSNSREIQRLEVEKEVLMHQTLATVKAMQFQIEYKITDHIIGLAAPHKIMPRNIQALASVYMESWYDDYASLHEEQGYRNQFVSLGGTEVPVVYISDVVATPNLRLDRAVAELVYRIVAWAEEIGRRVMLTPANEDLEEYYTTLGFRRIDAFTRTMVYHAAHDQDTSRRCVLLDFRLGVYEDPSLLGLGVRKRESKLSGGRYRGRRGRSGYMLYAGKVRAKIKDSLMAELAEGRQVRSADVTKVIAARWRAMEQEERNEWGLKALDEDAWDPNTNTPSSSDDDNEYLFT